MTSPNRLLVLGAGFSRNWGGWLANEFVGNLLDQPEVDEYIRNLLLNSSGGFEAVLDQLQAAHHPKLKALEAAIMRTFEDMNDAFSKIVDFNFSNDIELLVTKYLARFDAIFTLNQDALLELHYLSVSPELLSDGRIDGCVIPGMRRDPNAHPMDKIATWTPDHSLLSISPRIQPYIKLHGSSNWRSNGGSLLVVGGNKTSAIAREPVLKWGMERFQEYLSKADTRLVAIGYGFRDHHINTAIVEAAGGSQLSLYVVNPDGAEAANWECQGGVIPAKSALYQKVSPLIRGTSQRQLNTTFGRSDRAEHGKLIRWLG